MTSDDSGMGHNHVQTGHSAQLEKLDKDKIKQMTKSVIVSAIDSYIQNKQPAKFQILDKIFPYERRIRNIVGGLETSLGKTLWEPLGKAFAQANGFTVVEQSLQCPESMPASLANRVSDLMNDRTSESPIYNAQDCHQQIKQVCQQFINRPLSPFVNPPRGFGVDIWLKKDEVNYFFDTKTVQPNVGALTSCLKQVLTWYAYFYSQYPTEQAQCRIVFPYNHVHPNDFWGDVKGRGFPMESPDEAWVEDEFWDFCSGFSGTFSVISEALDEIGQEGIITARLQQLIDS